MSLRGLTLVTPKIWMTQEACAKKQEEFVFFVMQEVVLTIRLSVVCLGNPSTLQLNSYLVLTGSAICVVVAGNIL